MKKFFIIFLLATAASNVTAQNKVVYCVKFGEMNGPVRMFNNFCPWGWVEVK